MRKRDLDTILRKHARWLRNEPKGERADLQGAYLRGADLQGAYLQGAYLRGAYLRGAYLRGAYLRGADLQGAYLRGADLQGADLQGADLWGADLQGADLQGARGIAPPMLLLAYWGDVSDALCLDLMRYDCANCPDGEARFARWAADGSCPYGWSDEAPEKVARSANFQERRNLWSPGPAPSALDLMRRLLAEKCPPWTAEQRSAAEAKHAEKKVEAPHA